jgi:hypothetical protein
MPMIQLGGKYPPSASWGYTMPLWQGTHLTCVVLSGHKMPDDDFLQMCSFILVLRDSNCCIPYSMGLIASLALISPWVTTTCYIPEELVEITVLQQQWRIDGRCEDVSEHTGSRLLWDRSTKAYSPIWQVSQFQL